MRILRLAACIAGAAGVLWLAGMGGLYALSVEPPLTTAVRAVLLSLAFAFPPFLIWEQGIKIKELRRRVSELEKDAPEKTDAITGEPDNLITG